MRNSALTPVRRPCGHPDRSPEARAQRPGDGVHEAAVCIESHGGRCRLVHYAMYTAPPHAFMRAV